MHSGRQRAGRHTGGQTVCACGEGAGHARERKGRRGRAMGHDSSKQAGRCPEAPPSPKNALSKLNMAMVDGGALAACTQLQERSNLNSVPFIIRPESLNLTLTIRHSYFFMNYGKASTITQLISDSSCACKLFCHLDSQTKDCRHGGRSKKL